MDARFLHFSPITPASYGNGLAMRASLFAEALAQIGRVDVAVIGSPLPEGETWRPENVTVHHIATEGRLDTRLRLISQIPDLAARLAALRAFERPMSTLALSAPVLADAATIAGSGPWTACLVSRANLLPLLDALPRPLPPVIVDLDDDDAVLLREWAGLKSRSSDHEGAAWLEAQADLVDGLIVRSKGKVSAFACASEVVQETLASRLALHNVVVIPNGVDTSRMEMKAAPSRTMIFVGNLSYEPNVDGVIWFCTTVFPVIRKHIEDARLIVAGSRPTDAVREACRGAAITLHADVPDLSPLYREACLCVVPLRSGSGSRIKILEAAVHGLPVASTSKGAQGLSAAIQNAIFVGGDDPDEFARLCAACLSKPESALVRAGELQALVARHHGRAAIMSRIQALVGELASP
jgi:glycosyltransferase involved in cell wall biosynthesis